jgi:hypothetical protein
MLIACFIDCLGTTSGLIGRGFAGSVEEDGVGVAERPRDGGAIGVPERPRDGGATVLLDEGACDAAEQPDTKEEGACSAETAEAESGAICVKAAATVVMMRMCDLRMLKTVCATGETQTRLKTQLNEAYFAGAGVPVVVDGGRTGRLGMSGGALHG